MAYRVSGYIIVEKTIFCTPERFFSFCANGAKPKDNLMIQFWDFSTIM
jgi:hypothetical protein